MKRNDIAVTPNICFTGPKASIEAYVNAAEGMEALTTDTHEKGFYNGSAWVWGSGGGGSGGVYSGVYVKPVITDNGDGTITLGDGEYVTYADNEFSLPLTTTEVLEDTYSFTDNSTNYIIFTGSTGLITVTTDRSTINQSNVIPILTVYREGNELHTIDWDEMAKGLPNKLSDRLVRTERFSVETGGLRISEVATRTVIVDEGYVWFGGSRLFLDATDSSIDECDLWYHSSGNWTKSAITQYNNTQYDDGTNLQTTSGGHYVVNWVFRGVELDKHLFVVLGNSSYSLSEAEASSTPSTPSVISSQTILVGRIIVKQGESTAYAVQSAFTQTFNRAPVTLLNELGDVLITTPTEGNLLQYVGSEWINSNVLIDSKDPTGWLYPDDIVVTYDSTTREITLTGTLDYYWRGVKRSLISPWVSDPHDDTADTHYLFSSDGLTFAWDTVPWAFDAIMVSFVNYQTTYKWAQKETHGLMQWQVHEELHANIGAYKESGGTLDPASYTLLSTVAGNRRPMVVETHIHDEDIDHILAGLTSMTYNKLTLSGADTVNFSGLTLEIVPVLGNNPYYNSFVAPNWTQVLMANNSYMCVWLVAIPTTADVASQAYRYVWVQGQSNGSLASQQALAPSNLTLGVLTSQSPEFVFLVKLILRYTGSTWHIVSVDNLSGGKFNQVASSAGGYLSGVSTDGSMSGNGTTGSLLSTASGATTVTAAGTTTLTVASEHVQEFTGTLDQIVVMPDVSTLRLGQEFVIINSSGGDITVRSSGGNQIHIALQGTSVILRSILTTGTGVSGWSYVPSMTALQTDALTSGGETNLHTHPGGGGSVESVTGDGVDNTDPANPVLSFPTPADVGIPTTTAENDFQVGNNAGAWVKKTLAEVITILRTSLDSVYVTLSGVATLTYKRITPRVWIVVGGDVTITINSDSHDVIRISSLAYSTTISDSGTPTEGQRLFMHIKGTAARGITWNAAQFESGPATLPTTTITTQRLDIGFIYNAGTAKWRCMATGSAA